MKLLSYTLALIVDCQWLRGIPSDLLWRAAVLAALGPGSVQVQPPDAHDQRIHQHLHLCDKGNNHQNR